MEVGHCNKMTKKKYMISGLSILEALVSTDIVGIVFIEILKMKNSVSSVCQEKCVSDFFCFD